MALSNLEYETIIRGYEERQNKNRHILNNRFQTVYENVSGYKELDDMVSSLSVAHGKKLLSGDRNALSDLKDRLHKLAAERESLLVSCGYSRDYLHPVYDCPDCQDTGYIGNAKCHCFTQAVISYLYSQSGIQELLKTENFSSLSYEYYQGDDLQRFQNTVAACEAFIAKFDSSYQNLFFYGTVGTGKSFLSACIAKELIERGNSVIYFSSSNLFEILSEYSFDYKSKKSLHNTYEDLYGCDLFIIDDLGTELTNQFVNSQFFSCLNERHLQKKSTVISTNLSLEELKNRYSERIFSRITSNYNVCKLTGPDVRMYKKRLQSRK